MNATIDNPYAVITDKETVSLATEKLSTQPGPGQVLVKTQFTLISPGTELAIFQKTHVGFPDPKNTFAKYPFRAGYASGGQVLAVGEGITDFKPGDLVFLRGRHQAYSLVKPAETTLLPLPAGLSPKLAVYARMAQIASSSTEVSIAKKGEKVVVVGQGLVGNLAAQLFQLRGCEVLGIDLIPLRCEIGRKCGLNSVLVTPEGTVEQVLSTFAEKGARTVVEATGHPAAVGSALRMAAQGGEVILLGSTRGKVELDVYTLIHNPAVTVRGAHERVIPLLGGPQRTTALIAENIANIAAGRLKVEPLLSHEMDYREIEAAYRRLCDKPAETMSIVLTWPE